MSERCKILLQNKFGYLVRLDGHLRRNFLPFPVQTLYKAIRTFSLCFATHTHTHAVNPNTLILRKSRKEVASLHNIGVTRTTVQENKGGPKKGGNRKYPHDVKILGVSLIFCLIYSYYYHS
jgi:hypothetical protein